MRLFCLTVAVALAGCGSAVDAPGRHALAAADTTTKQPSMKTGAMVLAARSFDRFAGKTIGLIVNHTARVDTVHLIDTMHRAGVEIGALFGPEHGLRGDAERGERVTGGHDPVTGASVYSLYDATRAPAPEELAGLDVLVFDIQDVGARFYTYISTMGLAMQAAAEAGIPFVVLDRPNPLGGRYVSGFAMEPEHRSFVGKYPIPVVHGMTVGELARMIKGEGFLPGLEDLKLEVVEMEDWQRDMRWPETGLPWIAPSPNLPTFATALAYAGTCFFEATAASEGRGTRRPFTHVGSPWIDADALADTLNTRDLSGARFHPITFIPHAIPGMASHPKHEGRTLYGVRIEITDTSAYRPVETGIHILHAFYEQAQRKDIDGFIARPGWLKKLAGTERLLEMLRGGASPEAIIAAWQHDVQRFRERRKPYLLY